MTLSSNLGTLEKCEFLFPKGMEARFFFLEVKKQKIANPKP